MTTKKIQAERISSGGPHGESFGLNFEHQPNNSNKTQQQNLTRTKKKHCIHPSCQVTGKIRVITISGSRELFSSPKYCL